MDAHHPMLTDEQADQLERLLDTQTESHQAIVDMDPRHRNPQDVLQAIDEVQALLNTLQDVRQFIPPNRWRPIIITATQLKDALDLIAESIHSDRLPFRPLDIAAEWTPGPNGRKILHVNPDTLRLLESFRFKDWELEAMLGCSRRTLYTLRQRLGVTKKDFTDISDNDLNEYILRILAETSNPDTMGVVQLTGALKARGVSLPRERIRTAFRILRPSDAPSRFQQCFRRRVYFVPFANSLWHIDGHHKLIDWKIVIHGGIDGYSRTVTFLHASDNNRMNTVGDLFGEAVEAWGWPARVRADHGGENLMVKRMMEQARVNIQRPFVQGPSVRNQRIERLWGTLQDWATNDYRGAFAQLEADGHLDRNNAVELWCLHFCYLPMINRALKQFVQSHNNHSLRTENYLTPLELHLRSTLEAQSYDIDVFRAPAGLRPEHRDQMERHAAQNFEWYGVDEYGTRRGAPPEEEDPNIQVEPVLRGDDAELVAILRDPGVIDRLVLVAGPSWPPGEDWGRGRYTRVCDELSAILIEMNYGL